MGLYLVDLPPPIFTICPLSVMRSMMDTASLFEMPSSFSRSARVNSSCPSRKPCAGSSTASLAGSVMVNVDPPAIISGVLNVALYEPNMRGMPVP